MITLIPCPRAGDIFIGIDFSAGACYNITNMIYRQIYKETTHGQK